MNCYRGRGIINRCKQQCLNFLPFFKQFECRTAMVNQHSVRRTFGHNPQLGAPDSDTIGFAPTSHAPHVIPTCAPCGTSANRMGLGLLARGGCHAVSTKPLLPSVANTNPGRSDARLVFSWIGSCVGAPRGGCSLCPVLKPNICF
jgi:hypothetical protein